MNAEPESLVLVELKSQRFLWAFMAVLAFCFSGLALVFAVGALLGDSGSPASLIFGAVVVAIAVWGLAGGRLLLRLARARPRLLVSASNLVVEHPGLLREPLVIRRNHIEAVCLGSFVRYRRPPPDATGASRWRRLRSYSRWLDSGGTALTVSASEHLPDFSNVMGGRSPDVLVVLRRPYDLSTVPRRWLGIVAPEGAPFNVPVRGARIRGILGRAVQLDQARQAFSSWGVVVERPTEEMLAWISPSRRPHSSRG
jgi:hypothetical protein